MEKKAVARVPEPRRRRIEERAAHLDFHLTVREQRELEQRLRAWECRDQLDLF